MKKLLTASALVLGVTCSVGVFANTRFNFEVHNIGKSENGYVKVLHDAGSTWSDNDGEAYTKLIVPDDKFSHETGYSTKTSPNSDKDYYPKVLVFAAKNSATPICVYDIKVVSHNSTWGSSNIKDAVFHSEKNGTRDGGYCTDVELSTNGFSASFNFDAVDSGDNGGDGGDGDNGDGTSTN